MDSRYDEIAGQSLGRLAGLSDGVFAIAMTLLVLDLHVPGTESVHGERALAGALVDVLPQLLTFAMSFMTLGIFWVAQQTQLNHFSRSDRKLAWIHIGFLATVSLMPFSTALLSEFLGYRVALAVYWLNLLLLGSALAASWRYAERANLIRDDVPDTLRGIHVRRIMTYQALYADGALLGAFSSYAGVAAIAALQINAVIRLRHNPLTRITDRDARR